MGVFRILLWNVITVWYYWPCCLFFPNLGSFIQITAVQVSAGASSMAHDLRGPLAAIRNAVYVMESDPGKGAEMRKLILRAVENAVLMLGDVRDKTSFEALSRERVELGVFISSVLGGGCRCRNVLR